MPDINENRKAIYNALAKKGVNMGTYEQFDRAMSDTGNRKAVYDAARKHGINVGDYDTYENAIYASQQKLETKPVDAAVNKPTQTSASVQQPQTAPQQPVAKQQPQQKATTQQPQQPKGHPMTEADKARADEIIDDMKMSVAAKTKNRIDWIEGISKRKPWDVGNVNIGTDLLANGQKRNKNVVQKGGKYITQSGNAYNTAEEANEEQEEIDWQNSNAAKVAKMQKELEGLDKEIADEEGRLRVQTLADKDAIMYSNEKYNTMQKELGKTATSGKLQQLQQRQQELRNSIANLQRPGVRASVERMSEDLTTKIGKAYEAAGNKYRESGREGFDKWLAPMGGESTAYGGGIQDAYNHDYDVQILESARRSIKNAQNLINEADINAKNGTLTDWLNRSFAGGAARGLGQSAFDLRTWDFGLNDAVEAKNLLNILKKADNGQKLTANEQALLDAKATEAATLAFFGNEAGRGYKAGQVTGASLPFMVQLAVHPAAALGKTSQGMMMRYMVKRFGTAALKRSLASRMLTLGAKGAARLGGDIAASALITSTTGAGNVTAETMQRMAGNTKYNFTDKELKHIGYSGTKDREDATSAAVKSFVNNVLENFTEMGHVDVAGKWVKKGLAKITPKGLEKGLERFTQNDFAKALKELGQRTQFHGTIGEYLEEKEGDALRLILGTAEPGANWGTGKGGFFNLDENIDTFLGVGLMGGAFGVMGAAGYRTERYNARKAVENAGNIADAVFADGERFDNWRQIRNTLSFGSDEEVKDVMRDVFGTDNYTDDERKAVAQYAGAAYKMRGIKIAEAKAKAEGDNLMSAYDEGRSLSTAEEMNDARNMYEYRRKQAAEAMGISEDELEAQTEQSTPEMYLRVAMQQGADKGKAVEKYINSKARFDGMIDGLRDNINDKANEAEDAIRQNTNRSMEDAQVVEATLADGTHGYIVSGVVDVTEDGKVNASGTADFMTMRTDDGKVIAVAPSDIETASVNYADALIEQARADIEEQESTAAEANIENGGLNVEQGAPVNFIDDSGQVVNAVSEGVTQTEDGQTIVSLNVNGQSIQMPLDALRGAVDRFNRARAEQYARQEDATDIEQEGEGVQIEQGQTVTYVGADDTQYTATVMTEPDADGYVEIEVQLADGSKFVNRVKADELMQAATAIEGKPTTTAQTSEEEAQLPPPPTNMTVGEDGSLVEAQQPTEEQTRAIDRIPSHEANGTKVYDWEKAAPEDTYDALVETFGSMADKGVENSVKDIDKQLKAAEKALQKVEGMTIEQMMANPNAIADAQNLVSALNERKKYWESVKNVPTARKAQAEEERKRKEAENSLPPLPENVTVGEDGSLQAVDNNEEKAQEQTTEATEETPVAEEKENEPTVTEEPTEAAPTVQQAEEQNREERKQMLENMSIEELEKEIERIRNFNHPIFTMTEEEKAKEIAELQSIIDRKTQTSAQQPTAEEATPQAEEEQTANEDEQRDAVNKQVEKVLSEHGYHKGDMFRTHNMGNNAKAEIAGFDAGGVVLRTFDENGKQTAQYIELAENFLEMVDNGYLEPITEERKESEDKTQQNDSEGKQEEKKPQKPTSNRKKRKTKSDLIDELGQPTNVREWIMRSLYRREYKFIWDSNGKTKGLGQHLGLADSKAERKSYFWMLADKDKGGMYPESVAEAMTEQINDDLGLTGEARVNSIDVLNELLDVVGSYSSQSRLFDAIFDIHKGIEDGISDEEAEYLGNESLAKSWGFDSFAEYEAYKEMLDTTIPMNVLSDAEYNDYLQQEYNFYYEREREAEGGNPQGNAVLSEERAGTAEDAVGGSQEQGRSKADDNSLHGGVSEAQGTGQSEGRVESKNYLVSEERYAELKKRLRAKLGQMNMGVDPELLALGAEVAVYHIERGARKFADYAKGMIADMGDNVRPYLKAFYNAVRDMPEAADFAGEMTSYEDVRTFDVATIGKKGEYVKPSVFEKAQQIADEQTVARNAEEEKKATETTDNIVGEGYTITKQHNNKKDIDIWVVRPGGERVDKSVYTEWKNTAKKHGKGYWSSFTGVKGFVFEAPEDAKAFANEVWGKTESKPTEETKNDENNEPNVAREEQETKAEDKAPEEESEWNYSLHHFGGEYYVERESRDEVPIVDGRFKVRAKTATELKEILEANGFDDVLKEIGGNLGYEIRKEKANANLEAHGVKVGDKVIYRGKEATILDADPNGFEDRVLLDTGHAPIMQESAEWKNVTIPGQESAKDAAKQSEEKGKIESNNVSLPEDNSINDKNNDNGLERSNEAVRTDGERNGSEQGKQNEGLGKTAQQEAGRTDRGGHESGTGSLGSSDRRPAGRKQRLNRNNNRAERGTDYAPKAPDARLRANLEAIRLLKALQEEDRKATADEMAVLRKYSGWGGLGGHLDRYRNEITELIGDEGYQQAHKSGKSAYFTPAWVIDSMWDVAKNLGFKGGNILEGSAGIGNILGLMPQSMSDNSNIRAVEIDDTSADILAMLYPDAEVEKKGFEQTEVENNSVDLAITNVPFIPGWHVTDESGDKDLSRKFKDIHNFCIAKNIRKLKQGGIGIFITTRGTLDNSTSLRKWIENEGGADVVGAFRLNRDTFGGTNATSDIIVVRKRVNGEKSADAINIQDVAVERVVPYRAALKSGGLAEKVQQMPVVYNKYFVEHPENMGGKMEYGFENGDTFRPTSIGLYAEEGTDQQQKLQQWVNGFKQHKTVKAVEETKADEVTAANEKLGEGVKEGSLLVNSKGELCVARRGNAVPLQGKTIGNKVKGYTKAECLNDYNGVKSALAEVIKYQSENNDDKGLAPLLKNLNDAYDKFVGRYGRFSRNTAISFLRNDVDFANARGLEKVKVSVDKNTGKEIVTYSKADVFSHRVMKKETEVKPETVEDAMQMSLFQKGDISLPYMAEAMGKTEDEIRNYLLDNKLAFVNPLTDGLEVSYMYVSGNVREKLAIAKANNKDGRYDKNIEALEKAVPLDIPEHLIDYGLGASWIPKVVFEDFIKEKTGIENITLAYGGGKWSTSPVSRWNANTEKNKEGGVLSEKCGWTYAHDIILAAIQGKTLKVSKTYTTGYGSNKQTHTEVDKDATLEVAAKTNDYREEFGGWAREYMRSHPELAKEVENTYNDLFNNYVPMDIPENLVQKHYPGMTHQMKGKPFELYPHQGKAVQKALNGNTLFAHEVGAGKTFTLITTAMEMRRLGMAKKPMIVVQNATIGQFVESAKELYPNAKILAYDSKEDAGVENRKNFYAKIKYNDWDMVVIPQSTLDLIPDSDERQINYIQEKIDEKVALYEQLENNADASDITLVLGSEIQKLKDSLASLTAKSDAREDHETAINNAEARIKERLDRKTDEVENFDEMDIDAILVDEAHNYKHLGFETSMVRGIKGVDATASKRSQSVFLKCQAVMDKSGGKNVVFATGTPISNTAAEMWTFLRYLMPRDVMEAYNIYHFDDFVHNFGRIATSTEFQTNGKFKDVTRFLGYNDIPELVRIWTEIADTVLTSGQKALLEKLPDTVEGNRKATFVYLPQNRSLRMIMKAVRAELEKFEKMSGKEKKANSHIPLRMFSIAARAAIDPRLEMEDAADEPNSKTNKAVEATLDALRKTDKYKGTVAIFADAYQNASTGFNLYDEIKRKLVERGVPEKEIFIVRSGMTQNAKDVAFDKINKGEIRVVLGSTSTLGTGVNIQERLHTLINMDVPNRPMDLTQRVGRILRQGNLHKEWNIPVQILNFGVEDTLDVTGYQRLKTKANFINVIMRGSEYLKNNQENRTYEEDEEVMSFADATANLSGSQFALLKNQAERKVKRLESKKAQHIADQKYIAASIPMQERLIERRQGMLKTEQDALDKVSKAKDTAVVLNGKKYKDLDEMKDAIKDIVKKQTDRVTNARTNMRYGSTEKSVSELTVTIGGFDFVFKTEIAPTAEYVGNTLTTVVHTYMSYSCSDLGLDNVPVQRASFKNGLTDIMENIMTGNNFRENIERDKNQIERTKKELETLRNREGKVFEGDAELAEARKQLDEYTDLMKKELAEKEAKYAELDKELDGSDFSVKEAEEATEDDENDGIRFRDGAPLNPRGERMTAQNTSLDEAIAIQGSGIRYSTRVNHNSPFLLKRADGSFVDAETGETLGFDHRFMGTGEGAQVHGWGSYFSAKDIRRYAKSVDDEEPGYRYKGKTREDLDDENITEIAAGIIIDKADFDKVSIEQAKEALIKEHTDVLDSLHKEKKEQRRPASVMDDLIADETNLLKGLTRLKVADFKYFEPERHHYDVEIPDNDGTNYIEEKEPLSEKTIDRIVDAIDKRLRNTFKDTRTEGFYEWARVHHSEGLRQGQHFRDIREFLRDSGYTEEEISNVLHDAGFVGIHYDGRQDGECYVIFDENDARIVNHERFRDAEETEQNAERDEDAMERDARAFADELGTKVRVVRDVNEIEHPDAATQNRMRESLGWFDPKSGEVVVVIPNNTDAADVRATVLHEIVGHKGLQQVVGKEKFEDFLMKVYRGVDVETRKKINELAARNHWDFYEGIEEYIAQQAERGFEDRENAGLWRKIVQYVRDLLSEAKVRLGMNLGENDVRYMLWKTYQLKKGRRGVFAEAKDVALQNELGVGNYRYSRNVFGGNSGYVGYSKSKRAVRAENAGLRNKSQMNKEFADEVNELIKATNPDAEKVTLKQIKDALGDIKADEWHHTSMYGNRTNYYSAETIAKYFTPESEEEKTARESKANRYEEARAAYYDLHNELEKAAYDAMPKNENGKFVSSDGYEVMAQRNMLDKPQNLYNAGIIKGNRYYSGEDLYFEHREDYDRLEKEYNEAWQKAHDGVLTEDKKERLQQLHNAMSEADIDRYRFRDNGSNAAAHPDEADNTLRGVALEYNKRLGKGSYQAIEAVQDSMRSLLEVQRILEERSGKPLEDWENAYMAENAMSSRNNAEYEAWKRDNYKPLTEAVRALMESEGLSREGVEEYLYMKHGIERNREMSVRAAISEKAEREGKKAAHAEIRAQRDAAKQNGTDFKEPTDTERKRLEKQKEAEMQKQLRNDWKQKRDEIRKQYPNDWEKAQRELDKAATQTFGADLDAREYSGLTAIMSTDDVTDARTRAYDAVKQLMEDRPQECKALDDAVRNAASITLEKPFRSGLIDRATFDDISDMYEYYIPLRGFSETTAEEVYNYLRGDAGHGYSEPIKRAKGRMSQAESPLTYLVQMAQSALVQGNRNIMKQRFYNMALRRPSDLITVSEAWVVKQLNPQTGAEEWVTAYPQIKPEMSADEVEKAVADFENDMMQREAQGEAFKTGSKKGDGIPYRTLHDQLAEHQVIVKRAGREYVLTVNGNPRLAQAVNGKTNPNSNYEGVGGKVKKGLDDVNRKMSQLYTTANPDFVVSNLMRDTAYTWSMALIKEDAAYAKSFIGHWNKNLPKMWTLYNKLQHNTLNMNDPVEREFKNFVMNGGETGYSTLQELEDIKAELDKDLAKGDVKKYVDRKLEAFDRLNRSVENLARFSAYLASRDAGRTVERSVYDAKEISVNFNKKGAGGMFFGTNGQTKLGNIASSMSAIGRGGYIFWNAGIQGMANISKIAKRNPKKFAAGAAVGFALGWILSAIHGDDDDDELGYGDLPEYVRRSNIVIGAGGHYGTIPLPVEYRVMYGMGELAQRVLSGNEKYTNAELAEKVAATITQALPIDPLEGMSGGGKWYSPLIPSYAKPLAEVAVNSDWTGKPIYYENEWNKRNPEWTKVNEKTTNSILFATSKMLNEWTGGDDFTSGALDINPAIVEHLAQGYLGGLMTFGNRVMKTGETIVGARDYDSRNIPVANRIYKQPTEYTKDSRINSEYRKDVEDMRDLKQKERGYRQKAAEGNAEYAEKYRELVRSREYRKMLRFENLYKQVKKLNDDAGGDERAMKQVKRLKKDAVRVMDNEN